MENPSIKIAESEKNTREISESKKELLALEKEGVYVFHGSPENVDILKPKQAYNYNKKTRRMEKNSEPAISATPYAEIAIYRSLVNKKNVSGNSRNTFGINNDHIMNFSATENLLTAAKNKIGKVYVLNKKDFGNIEGMECRARKDLEPIKVIEVSFEDLPENIKLIETND